MEIPKEIRSKISHWDDITRELAEWFAEQDDSLQSEAGIDLIDLLQATEDAITMFQEEQGWLDSEPNMPGPGGIPIVYGDDVRYKEYEDVEVGDIAYQVEEHDQYIGIVVWKGTFEELEKSEHRELISDWDDDENGIGITTYNLVVVREDGFDNLLNYDNDPAGCIVLIDAK